MTLIRAAFFFSALLVNITIFAQGKSALSEQIKWEAQAVELTYDEGKTIQTLAFDGAVYDFDKHQLPLYAKKLPISGYGKVSAKLSNLQFEPLADTNIPQINEHIKDDIVVDAQFALEKKQPNAIISFIPIRRNPNTGGLERLVGFELELGVSSQALPKSGERDYTDNSVFNQGDLYEFTVTQTGIHRIDFDFLDELGITETVNLNNLRIYGNGGGMLPELAGTERYDDLAENPLKIYDQNNNGTFDAGDYALFYAVGPDIWTYNADNQGFEHSKHLYATASHYFLNYDIGSGKRVATQSSPSAANITVTDFDDYAFHENEWANLNHSGRQWYGEEFGGVLSRDFSFDFPNINTNEQAHLKTRVAATSYNASTSFNIALNGQNVQTHILNFIPNASYTSDVARLSSKETQVSVNAEQLNVNVAYNLADPLGVGRLDYIALNVRRHLKFDGGQMDFRDARSVGDGNIAQFQFQNTLAGNTEIWDVTHIHDVSALDWQTQGGASHFVANASELREYVIFDGTQYHQPASALGKAASQNLHALEFPDFIIVTHSDFLEQAERLADFHREQDGMMVRVVTVKQVYNEFSSGMQDVTAIRDYVKMHYDRASADPSKFPDYVLLFGDASYDYKNIEFTPELNHNFVPVYESNATVETTSTYCTDDYFGFLDDDEGDNINSTDNTKLMDAAIGRLPATTPEEARQMVDKILSYHDRQSLGDWRNNFIIVGDDENSNTHFNHSEEHTNNIRQNYPEYNIDKLYLDAYEQESTPGGSRYPDVRKAINDRIFTGTFVMNYVGHGGESGWAHERVLHVSDIQKWDNIDRLPLFITATCSFGRFDNPNKLSAAEHIILHPSGGGIAIVTTVRLVYASQNKRLNGDFLSHLYESENGKMLTIGEIMRRGKNDAANTGTNNRKFALLGDPALTLAYPKYDVVTTSVNGKDISLASDTLRALTEVTVTGEIHDASGGLLSDFNGTLYPRVFDKSATVETLANDNDSNKAEFQLRKNNIFKGQATVENGRFSFKFIVPKDIAYQYGAGRISYYAENGEIDANGYTENIIIGGIADDAGSNNVPPKVDVYMNDENFVFGGLTDDSPKLLVNLEDEFGINTVGNGIGHDITAVLDDDQRNLYVLNEYYRAAKDDHTGGSILYPLADLESGLHTIEIKAWDIHNNSGKGYTEFVVAETAALALEHVLNYPNPFTDKTSFWFEHNRPGDELEVNIQILSMSGRVVKSIHNTVATDGYRVNDIEWDGLDEFGQKIGKGVYLYRLHVKASDGTSSDKIEKLVILK